jgi:hypothetical protein
MKKPLVLYLAGSLLFGCARYAPEDLSVRSWSTSTPAIAPAASANLAVAATDVDGFSAAATGRNNLPETPLLHGNSSVGIAFSGGGNRAAVCALGQLRGRKEIGVLSQIQYISAVSGGSWFSVPYCFVDAAKEKAFLGQYVPPDRLHWNVLEKAAPHSFAEAATNAHMPILNILNTRHLRGDENFAYFLNKIYLQPFGLGNEHKFFCYDKRTLASIRVRNPSLSEKDFNISRADAPYLIANGVIVRPWRFFNRSRRFVPFEMTANYTGSGPFRAGGRFLDLPVGGGYVESFGYDSKLRSATPAATKRAGLREWQARVHLPGRWGLNAFASPRFSLSDVIACSGAAPSVVLPELSYLVGFPEFQHWSAHELPASHSAELIHTDGGGLDNSGVLPLLRRNVKTIIAFVNAQTEVRNNVPSFPGYVSALFGEGKPSNLNLVFPVGGLAELRDEFLHAWESKAPLIFQKNYQTLPNENYGIPGGQDVRVIWVFLGPSGSFVEDGKTYRGKEGSSARWYHDLAKDSKDEIRKAHQREFRHFPFYQTFFENPPSVIRLNAPQVNALAQFTAYQVVAYRELFGSTVAAAQARPPVRFPEPATSLLPPARRLSTE